jgi:hypothetical protein
MCHITIPIRYRIIYASGIFHDFEYTGSEEDIFETIQNTFNINQPYRLFRIFGTQYTEVETSITGG